MIVWLIYTVGAITIAGMIGGYDESKLFKGKFESSLQPKINPKDNARHYTSIAFFLFSQSSYVTYANQGTEELIVRIAVTLITVCPIAYGLGYIIRKNNMPSK